MQEHMYKTNLQLWECYYIYVVDQGHVLRWSRTGRGSEADTARVRRGAAQLRAGSDPGRARTLSALHRETGRRRAVQPLYRYIQN